MDTKDIMDKLHSGLELAHQKNIPVIIKDHRYSDVVTDTEIILYKEDSPSVWMETIHNALKNRGIFWWKSEADTLESWNEILSFNYSND